mmetsp:Transcript_41339/g.125124  ORF Transcript_41339/g.125124 Transcript_41339/m.125124 type:complete len:308 (-) Transcript_41339:361-1284(-)
MFQPPRLLSALSKLQPEHLKHGLSYQEIAQQPSHVHETRHGWSGNDGGIEPQSDAHEGEEARQRRGDGADQGNSEQHDGRYVRADPHDEPRHGRHEQTQHDADRQSRARLLPNDAGGVPRPDDSRAHGGQYRPHGLPPRVAAVARQEGDEVRQLDLTAEGVLESVHDDGRQREGGEEQAEPPYAVTGQGKEGAIEVVVYLLLDVSPAAAVGAVRGRGRRLLLRRAPVRLLRRGELPLEGIDLLRLILHRLLQFPEGRRLASRAGDVRGCFGSHGAEQSVSSRRRIGRYLSPERCARCGAPLQCQRRN